MNRFSGPIMVSPMLPPIFKSYRVVVVNRGAGIATARSHQLRSGKKPICTLAVSAVSAVRDAIAKARGEA